MPGLHAEGRKASPSVSPLLERLGPNFAIGGGGSLRRGTDGDVLGGGSYGFVAADLLLSNGSVRIWIPIIAGASLLVGTQPKASDGAAESPNQQVRSNEANASVHRGR